MKPGEIEHHQMAVCDGIGAHVTLGYLPQKTVGLFRKVFEACLALLPDDMQFVTGLCFNSLCGPDSRLKVASSCSFDLCEIIDA